MNNFAKIDDNFVVSLTEEFENDVAPRKRQKLNDLK